MTIGARMWARRIWHAITGHPTVHGELLPFAHCTSCGKAWPDDDNNVPGQHN